ncbi:MAG: type I DNA topoisomerase [Deltaproteobacteria bacterium]|nr:type I DNA topoisomerase [Deltaproteobacteria bacterium]
MSKPLIIVESPAKATTIKKYLKGEYEVLASAGHIKDLPEKSLAVDVDKDFKAKLRIVPAKRKIVDRLKKAAADADRVLLAPDPDREGEAIAWHIAQELSKVNNNIERILFNEITRSGVRRALESPRELNERMYESQLARRVLDRLVGYQISPLLWRKVQGRLSAGRVQSVALRLIVEREREIEAFDPREYWIVSAVLERKDAPSLTAFRAKLIKLGEKKAEVSDKEQSDTLISRLKATPFLVGDVERKDVQRFPARPFITSTLQQEASRRMRFSPARTMSVAQRLYEGMELGGRGRVGLITYMRTDSVRLSDEVLAAARSEIASRFGPQYVPPKPRIYKNKKQAQDAHEAIRPTTAELRPEEVKPFLKDDEFRLYRLIYQRFLACQMAPAVDVQTTVTVTADDAVFQASGSVEKFPGFRAIWNVDKPVRTAPDNGRSENGWAEGNEIPPGLTVGEELNLLDLLGEQNFTKPKPRFSEASLVRELEERGIGRPSTYASIVKTIQDKGYSEKREGRLRPSELGRIVNDLLVEHFSEIVDYDFTAHMEEDLDRIAEGEKGRLELLTEFYKGFKEALDKAAVDMKSMKTQAMPSGIACSLCGKEMLIRFGKNGPFLGCSGYPDCRNTSEFERDEKGKVTIRKPEEVGSCPKCGKPLLVRSGKFGRFIACSGFPDCDFKKTYTLPQQCPEEGCTGHMVEKRSRKGKRFFSCERYPDCKFSTSLKPLDQPCPQCGAPNLFLLNRRNARTAKCLRESCGYTGSVGESSSDTQIERTA